MNLHSVIPEFGSDMTHTNAIVNDEPNHIFQKAAIESEVAFLTSIFFREAIRHLQMVIREKLSSCLHLKIGLGKDITCTCTVSK